MAKRHKQIQKQINQLVEENAQLKADIKKNIKKSRSAPVVLPSQPNNLYGWNTSTIQNAIIQQSGGDFSRITDLGNKILTDAWISAAVEKRINSLTQSEIKILPASEDDQDVAIADVIHETCEQKLFSEQDLKEIYMSFLKVGVYLGYINWVKDDDGFYKAEITHLHTAGLSYHHWDCEWRYNHRNGYDVVQPGNGNWILISTWKPGQIAGFASKLGETWLYTTMTMRVWMDGNRRSSSPTIFIQHPEGQEPEGDDQTNKLLQEVAQYANQAGVAALFNGATVNTIDLGKSWDSNSFNSIIEKLRDSVSLMLNGGTAANTTGGFGSAAAEIHSGEGNYLAHGDGKLIATELRRQLLIPYLFNNQLNVDAPFIKFETEPREDHAAKLDQAMKLLELAGPNWKIEDPQTLGQEINLNIVEINEDNGNENEENSEAENRKIAIIKK